MNRFAPVAVLIALACTANARADCIAIVPLAIVPVGMSDEVLPTKAQTSALDRDVRTAVASHARAVMATGASCIDAECATHAARRENCRVAIYGGVTRYMALLWSLQLDRVDAATGRQTMQRQLYKGDFLAIEHGVGALVRELIVGR